MVEVGVPSEELVAEPIDRLEAGWGYDPTDLGHVCQRGQHGANVLLLAPPRAGRPEAGRPRVRVRRQDVEEVLEITSESLTRELGDADHTALASDPEHLLDHDDIAERVQHTIEVFVGERKSLCIPLYRRDRPPLAAGSEPTTLDLRARDVKCHHDRAKSCSREGRVAAASGHVEHPVRGRRRRPLR